MFNIYVAHEPQGEPRVSLIPKHVKALIQMGYSVSIETQAGLLSGYIDEDYEKVGASIVPEQDDARRLARGKAQLLCRLQKPEIKDLDGFSKGCIHLSFLDPFFSPDLLKELARRGFEALSLEMIPRSTIAQKMDVLSSQASLAGYAAVLQAASRLPKVFPMMMTPSGNISPARVFIIGVGVAGLQAIATAKRLGARVEAFDTRPQVEEQVRSLGARFVQIDLGETGESSGGYAKELSAEQLAKQQEAQARVCAQSDIVITTAKVFGRKSPRLIPESVLAQMKPGSIVIDLAVAGGGNVEGSVNGEEVVTPNGVRILGLDQAERLVAKDASDMLSGNIFAFIEHFTLQETVPDASQASAAPNSPDTSQTNTAPQKCVHLNLSTSDPIIESCRITQNGQIVHPKFQA